VENVSNEELVQLYQSGDKQALERLIVNNKGIVHKVISRFYINSNSFDKEDLFQEGCIGLVIAAKKYDFNNIKKAKFITYAVNWINQRASRFIIQKNTSDEISLNEPISSEGAASLIDNITSKEDLEKNIVEVLYQRELRVALKESMLKVNTLREREIIEFNYGLCCAIPLSIPKIADILNITPIRAKYECDRGMRHLKQKIYVTPLKKYKDELGQEHQEKKYKNINNLFNSLIEGGSQNEKRCEYNKNSAIIEGLQSIKSSI